MPLPDVYIISARHHRASKTRLFVSLKEEQGKPGQVLVGFAADRAHLDKIAGLRVNGERH